MKELLLFNFPKEKSGQAITYNLIKTYDLKVNIIRASIDYNPRGFLLIEIEGDASQVQEGIEYVQSSNVKVTIIDAAIRINRDKCLDCGACCAVCAVDALHIDDNAELHFDKDLCLDCKLCVSACPARAIESIL